MFSVVYGSDNFFTNGTLQKVGQSLMQQINDICVGKLKSHLDMLNKNMALATQQKDQDIRFDRAHGEHEDEKDGYLIDQAANFESDVVEKTKKARELSSRKGVKNVESFLWLLGKGEGFLPKPTQNELIDEFGLPNNPAAVEDVLLMKEWRVCDKLLGARNLPLEPHLEEA